MKRATILLCFAVFLTVSCEKSEQESQSSKTSFTPCRQDILKSNSLSDKVEVEFTDKGVQITYYGFEVTCDFTTVDVTHTFANGFLNIMQQSSPDKANCICYTDVSYTIDEISQSEVNVIFINGKQVYCYNENGIYENHDIAACGVNDALQNIEWLREFCENLYDTQDFSSVYIHLYKVKNTDEHIFKIGISYPDFDISPFLYSEYWRNCIGEIIFTINSGMPPSLEAVEIFLEDKEYVTELFHLVKK